MGGGENYKETLIFVQIFLMQIIPFNHYIKLNIDL